MTRELVLLGLFAGWMALAPWWFVRASRRYLAWDVGGWVAIVAAFPLLELAGVQFSSAAVVPAVMAVKLAAFFLFCIRHESSIRWSPLLAGVFTLGILLLAGAETLESNVDGDESYYLLQAESLLADGDLDLKNQYASLERSVTRRRDLVPQLGDLTGPRGEQYARHEPFLAFLLVPGVAAAGLWGAVATMVLFGAALTVSLLKLLEESGASRAALLRLWPLLSFAPPLLFYSVRVWPEVPAALCLSEAIRHAGRKRIAPAGAWLLALSLLQFRFALIAIVFAVLVLVPWKLSWKTVLLVAALVALPFTVAWLATGEAFLVHQWSELRPAPFWKYARGLFGLLLDTQTGMLFQAPLWLCGVLGLMGWGSLPQAARRGAIAAVPYLILLLPRDEWHGGWSPPLRYLVVFAPLAAMGAWNLMARAESRRNAPEGRGAWLVPVAIWSALVAFHGLAWPGHLFRIATGESTLGEWLSMKFGSDVSRLLPSFIRPNTAAWVASLALVAIVALFFIERWRARTSGSRMLIPGTRTLALAIAALIAAALVAGTRPGSVVEMEDAHVERRGGEIYPEPWTVARFRYTGGWSMNAGDRARFEIEPGPARIRVMTAGGATLRLGGELVRVDPTGGAFAEVRVVVTRHVVELEVVEGEAVIDRIEHD